MKTSAVDTQQIDGYLLKQLPQGDKLVFDAKLMLCPELKDTVKWQHAVHQLIQLRGRQQLKAQIKGVEEMMFSQPEYSTFWQRILRLFSR